MRIYISGKITGLPIEEATVLFENAEDFLNEKYSQHQPQIINPLKINHEKALEMQRAATGRFSEHEVWAQFMKEDLGALLNCDVVFMLKNWGASKGARVEHAVAKEINLTVEYEH